MTSTTRSRGNTTLAQLIAIEGGTRTRVDALFTSAYHTLQKAAPLSGIARNYVPSDDDGERLPSESTLVQVRADEVTASVAEGLTRLFDVTITKDAANCIARADIVIDGAVLIADVPLTFLLTLEKKLVDLRTYLSKLPVLDIAERWEYDRSADAWATPIVETTRTKKIPRNHVKAPATDKHPAQVEIYTEDVIVGRWATTKFSGAIQTSRRNELVVRVEKLIDAVRFAREAANTTPVTDIHVGETIFGFLLA